MEPEIIAAFIALAGAVLSVIITVIINFWHKRYNYNQLFAETVSQNRMEWINVWRENISDFLACAETLRNNTTCGKDELVKLEKEMYAARGMVVSRLNLEEKDHQSMLVLMNTFVVHCSEQDFINQREDILALARKILKPEWERVKDEARGKRYATKK